MGGYPPIAGRVRMEHPVNMNLVGGFNHLEKYESQWE